ncbi:SCP-domain-containing protein [Martensiomyces pterosporus]|nr:SCP-domain-containing protein [Martensiomyces pterosporus]
MVKLFSAAILASAIAAMVCAAPLNAAPQDIRDGTEAHLNLKRAVVTKTIWVTVHASGPTPAPHVPAPGNNNPPPNKPAPPAGQPAPSDWRADMLNQLNALRAKNGKPAVRLDTTINNFAQEHSQYQNSIHKMTHDDPRGGVGDRLRAAGIQWRGAAENVVAGSKNVADAMKAWTNSPPHFQNMMGDYNIVGFGLDSIYWTMEFAKI